jgi:hypothetical protein
MLNADPMCDPINFRRKPMIRSDAPGGDKDEACANAGLEKIKDRLN